MKIKALFIDMDGTLLNRSNTISNRNVKAIDQLMNQGVHVFLATGRHYEITAPYHRELGLQTPMICLNGAAIYEAENGKMIEMHPVHLNKKRLHDATEPYNVIIHTANGFYCKNASEDILERLKIGKRQPQLIDNLNQANVQDVLKYSVRTGKPSPELSALFKKEAKVINWNDGFEIVAPKVSKWSAIQSIIKKYRIHPHEVAAIGDGPNDIEMLQHAGVGIAMKNAGEKVKFAADMIAGHHENDGLAEFIEHYLLRANAI